jgi:hypothetical protein
MNSRSLLDALPIFTVASSGSADVLAPLALQSANQSFPLLARLAADVVRPPLEPVGVESFGTTEAARGAAARLQQLFNAYGSDKSQQHNYHHLYGNILQNPAAVTAVFEIGLGSNHEDVVSNMGSAGRPGASLRAFRDFLPNARVYGADVDRRVLFAEDRIETFFIDQTDVATMDALSLSLAVEFDLMIDDGLHTPGANLAALVFGLPKLKLGGVFVVEDVQPVHFPVWQVVRALLPQQRFNCFLVHAMYGCLFAIQRVG